MSLNSEMKDHMDAIRKVTGVSGLLDLASSTDALNSYNGIVKLTNKVALNSFTKMGIYYGIGSQVSNKAGIVADNDELMFINLASTDSYAVQLFFENNLVWIRFYLHSAWTTWYKLGGGSNCFPKIFKQFKALLSLTVCKGGVTLVA